MPRTSTTPAWQTAIIVLSGTVVVTVLILALHMIQEVFIPLALAIYLSFLLKPAVRLLESRGGGRLIAVFAVVGLAAVLMAAGGWLVASQSMTLVNDLPNHTAKMRAKIQSFRAIGSGGKRFEKMVLELTDELENRSRAGAPSEPKTTASGKSGDDAPVAEATPAREAAWWPWISEGLTPALGWGATFALALVLAVFMLLGREDLRSRFLRLTGQGRMPSTTKAVDDAGTRISRYLVMQLILNVTFGVLVGVGLAVIGVPYAVLWGFVAATLRYVPYIGPLAAAAFPLGASLVVFDGWWQATAVLALFLALDLTMNNIVEPWAFGHSMGVSQVGLITAAAFCFWLWGPVGLVLSAPLTVVLVVLGKYVPQLKFLDTLLGDQPALAPETNYYQRLLARDADEATDLVLTRLKAEDPDDVYDEFLIPALNQTKRDRSQDELTELDEEFVHQTTREILEDLGERRLTADAALAKVRSTVTEPSTKVYILGSPAQDESDELALQMLQQLMDPNRWEVEVTTVETLTSELLARITQEKRPLVCIGSLPPGGLAHTRYLCKRLRAGSPEMMIIVGRWGLKGEPDRHRSQLLEAGADHMTTTLVETRRYLESVHSVLEQRMDPQPQQRPDRESAA